MQSSLPAMSHLEVTVLTVGEAFCLIDTALALIARQAVTREASRVPIDPLNQAIVHFHDGSGERKAKLRTLGFPGPFQHGGDGIANLNLHRSGIDVPGCCVPVSLIASYTTRTDSTPPRNKPRFSENKQSNHSLHCCRCRREYSSTRV